jgi:tetratricopeptide (TPR) repeat protein
VGRRWTSLPVAAVLLAALAAALYGARLRHEFVTDDLFYIVENPAVVRGAPLAAYFTDRATIASDPEFQWQSYRPLRTLAFRVIARLGGVAPLPFGLANLALYLAAALLILALARRLGLSAEASLAATALWLVAPVHVEPVLYCSALGDHLSLVLELGALLLAIRPGRFWPAVSLLLAMAAMLAKEMAVTAPLLIGLVAWAVGNQRRRVILLIGAHGAVVVLFLAARTAVLHALGHRALTGAGVLAGVAMAPVRLGAYLRISAAPLGHNPGYVLPWAGWAVVVGAWLALGGAVLAMARAGRLARVGLAWFALALLPVLGLVPIFADLADRFALLPSVGLALAAPGIAAGLARRSRLAGVLAAALLFPLYAAATVVEGAAWTSEVGLWSKAVALEPRSGQAHRNLAVILLRGGDAEGALRHLDQARALGDDDATNARRRATALEALGRFAEAEQAAVTAVARDPGSAAAQALLGGLLVRRGALAQAGHHLALAAARDPDAPSVLLLAVELATRRGDRAAVDRAEARLIARYPAEPRFRHRRASTLLEAGDHGGAAAVARDCLHLAPGHPQCQCLLGRALVAGGDRGAMARQALDAGLAQLPPGPERAACAEARP